MIKSFGDWSLSKNHLSYTGEPYSKDVSYIISLNALKKDGYWAWVEHLETKNWFTLTVRNDFLTAYEVGVDEVRQK